jgi:hypothetical protein
MKAARKNNVYVLTPAGEKVVTTPNADEKFGNDMKQTLVYFHLSEGGMTFTQIKKRIDADTCRMNEIQNRPGASRQWVRMSRELWRNLTRAEENGWLFVAAQT